MRFFSKNKLLFIGLAAGALGGYLWFHLVGCENGTCIITSSPVNSTLYGAMMGGLFFNLFRKEDRKSEKQEKQ